MFTTDKPVIFAYHGYPAPIHRLTYRRANQSNFHVHGYQEEGTTKTPFDMAVLNRLDRFHLANAVVERVSALATARAGLAGFVEGKLAQHDAYIGENGEDLPEIRNCRWQPAL